MPDRVRSQRPRRRARPASLGGTVAALAWGFAWRQMVRRARHHEAMAAAANRDSERPMTAYEPSDWELGPVAIVYGGTLVLLIVSCLVLIAAYPSSVHDVSRALHMTPPGPQLQTNPGADLKTFRAAEEKQLESYYWIDRQKGLVHIPIEEAMKKLVQTGIPGFAKAAQP
jgi:hypothetical protein